MDQSRSIPTNCLVKGSENQGLKNQRRLVTRPARQWTRISTSTGKKKGMMTTTSHRPRGVLSFALNGGLDRTYDAVAWTHNMLIKHRWSWRHSALVAQARRLYLWTCRFDRQQVVLSPLRNNITPDTKKRMRLKLSQAKAR